MGGQEAGLRAEVDGREKELAWLEKAAGQLDGQDRISVEKEAQLARQKYEHIVALLNSRQAKEKVSLTAQSTLETELKQLRQWLSEFEERVSKPYKLHGTSLEEYKQQMQLQAELEKDINQHSLRVSTVLNEGEVLLLSSAPQLKDNLSELESDWTQVCSLTTARGTGLERTWGK